MPAEPIHQECTSLQERVSACESLLDVLDGLKYIDGNPVALEDGSGYQLNVVSVTMGENNQWTVKNEEPIVIKHGSKGADGHTPVVTIKDGNWWIDGVDTGEKAVPADGKDAPTPTFHIWDGVLWYTFAEKPDTSDNGKPTAEDTKGWTSLGNVVGPKGETGEQGPQGPEGIHGLEITRVTDVNDPNYGAVKISYNNGEETVTEYLPTYEMFLELKTKVEDAEENISALLSLATAMQTQTFVTGYEFIKEKGVIVGCKVSTVKVVLGPDGKTYTTQTATSEIRPNDLIKLDKDERGWYWSIPEADGTASKHYLDAEKTFVPDFEIINGHLYVSLKDGANENNINDAAYWEDLGTVQTILAGHDGEDAEVTPNDPLVSIEQKDGKVIFTFAGSSPIEVPTQTAFAALVGRVTALEQNAATFNSLFNALKGYEFVKNFEIEKDDKGNTIGFKITFASYTEKYEDGKFVGYDWKIETKTINYKDAGLLSFTVKDGDYYWVLPDGTEIPVDGPFVPEFRINDADGKLYVSLVEEPGDNFSDENKWKCLGLVTPELAEGDKIIVSVVEEKDEAGEMTGYLVITFRNPSNDDLETLRLPTAAAFKQLQDDVAAANSNIEALQKAVAALEAYDHVLSFEPIYDSTGRVTIGYHFKFKNSGDVYIYDGKTPSVRINEDGNWEVSYDGTAWEEVKDKNGKPVSAIGIQGENGKTPTFKIDENGEWRISWDGGASWEDKSLGQATGKDGDAFFESVTELDLSRVVIDPLGPNKDATPAYLRIKLTNGKIYEIPTQYTIQVLQGLIDEYNRSVTALSELVNGKDFVTGITEVTDAYGRKGWTITFTKSPSVTFYNGLDGETPEAPVVTIGENGNWFIDGEDTGKTAVAQNGKDAVTPHFDIIDGFWNVSYDAEHKEWEQILDENGKPIPATGESGASFFTHVQAIQAKDANGQLVTDENNKPVYSYLLITNPNGDVYRIPTDYEIKRLEGLVNGLNTEVAAYKEIVNGKITVTAVVPIDKDGNTVSEDKAAGYRIEFSDPTKNFTIWHGTDAALVTIGDNGNWFIGSTDTGVSAYAKTPIFKVVNGTMYYTFEGSADDTDESITGSNSKWFSAGSAQGAQGDSFFTGVVPVYITSETPLEGYVKGDNDLYYKLENGEKIIAFLRFTLSESGRTIDVPTEWTTRQIETRMTTVETNLELFNNIFKGRSFVESVVETTDENGIVLGYEVKTVTLDENLNIKETKTTLINGLVRPYQVDGLWHCEILTYDKEGNAEYVSVASGASSLSYIVVGQYLWLSTDPKAAADLKTEDFTPVEGTNGWKRVAALPYLDNGANLGKVEVNKESVTFNFGTSALTVPRFFKKPEFLFSSDFIDDNNVFVYPKQGTGYETLNFKITGSFAEKPEIHIVCEGNWRSKNLQYDRESETTVSGSVGIQPTSAYIGDDCSGRLSLYISYYGNTYITQLDLSAEGSLEYQPLSLDEFNKASFSITTDMIPDGQLPVIAYNYGDEFRWIHSTVERDPSNPDKFKITVNCDRNIGGERTGTIVVFNQKGGRELLRLKVPQEGFTGKIHNLAHPTGTGAIVPANCYIITGKENTTNDPEFLYMIPAYKGNDTNADKFRGIKKYEELWNDSGNKIDIDPDGQLDEMILFTVDGNNEGNAVIAIKDVNDKILWSWHLWFCPNANVDEETGIVTPGDLDVYGSNHIMDRNLGARSPEPVKISTTAYEYIPQQGMFYQWGRKDPIVINAGEVATTYPLVFDDKWSPADDSWGTKKTETDPCPPGYKVPKSSVLANYAAIEEPLNAKNKDFLLIKGAGTMVGEYPLGGYYDIAENTIKTVTTRKSETLYHAYTQIWTRVNVLIEFYCDEVDTLGSLWSSESDAIIEYKKTSYQYNEAYFDEFKLSNADTGEGLAQNIWNWILSNSSDAVRTAVKNAIDERNDSTPLKLTGGKDDSNKNGHQVRCVRE